MTQPIMPDGQPDRRQVFDAISAGLDVGLPAPLGVAFICGSPDVTLENVADLRQWAARFGYAGDLPATFGQPHPNLADPFQSDQWLTNLYMDWRGYRLRLGSKDAITEEQQRHWVDSGRAADHAEPKPADADPTGLTYSRELDEADDPTPVSPARGGPVHTGAVTDEGLVDETPAPTRSERVKTTILADLRGPLPGEVDETPAPPEQITVYFSFGHGHTDPDTGQSLLNHYVTIIGPSHAACREAMFASKYGRAWAFDYIEGESRTEEWIPRWTEHERIILPVAPVRCSPECDAQDDDRPHRLDCPFRLATEARR